MNFPKSRPLGDPLGSPATCAHLPPTYIHVYIYCAFPLCYRSLGFPFETILLSPCFRLEGPVSHADEMFFWLPSMCALGFPYIKGWKTEFFICTHPLVVRFTSVPLRKWPLALDSLGLRLPVCGLLSAVTATGGQRKLPGLQQ